MAFRLTALPEAMRDFGVTVVEVGGWQSRGHTFPAPLRGGIDHWTVGAATGEAPSLAICTYGRSDLPGPLCNVLRGRRTNGTPRAFMVAAGKANHAGRGYWSGADSNYELFGLEVEYRPYAEPIRDEDLDVDARIHAAAAQVCGYRPSAVAGHWEYATPEGRKVDRKTVPDLRSRVAAAFHQEDDMTPEQAGQLNAIYDVLFKGADKWPTNLVTKIDKTNQRVRSLHTAFFGRQSKPSSQNLGARMDVTYESVKALLARDPTAVDLDIGELADLIVEGMDNDLATAVADKLAERLAS